MKVLVLLITALLFSGCLTPGESSKNLPATAGKKNVGNARQPNDRYYLPNRFDCYKPGDTRTRAANFPQFNSDYRCMVCNCVHEMGVSLTYKNSQRLFNEQIEVNKTVFTRVRHPSFPMHNRSTTKSDECGVIYDRKQFSWTWGGKGWNSNGSEKSCGGGKCRDKRGVILNRSQGKVRMCENSVKETYEKRNREVGATHYYSAGAAGSWLSKCRQIDSVKNKGYAHKFCYGLSGKYPVRPISKPSTPIEANSPSSIAKILRSFGYEI